MASLTVIVFYLIADTVVNVLLVTSEMGRVLALTRMEYAYPGLA